jgi:branched-subunit amino acid transport protein
MRLFTTIKGRIGLMFALMVMSIVPACATADPAFDWSTNIGGIKTVLTDTIGANIGAIFTLLGLFVALAYVWKLIRKAGARTR